MNKLDPITVIEWKNGKDAETFTKDEDFREGTKTGELAGKWRVRWDDDKSVEWLKSDMFVKFDNRHFSLVRPEDVLGEDETDIETESDITDDPDSAVIAADRDGTNPMAPMLDNGHASVEMIETAIKAGEDAAKPARRTRTASK